MQHPTPTCVLWLDLTGIASLSLVVTEILTYRSHDVKCVEDTCSSLHYSSASKTLPDIHWKFLTYLVHSWHRQCQKVTSLKS